MSYTCGLIDQTDQPVLSMRTRSPAERLPQVLGEAYKKIRQYMEEIGEEPSGAPFAAFYNMDKQDLDVEAGFLVSKALPGKGEIQPGEIPAGKHAVCLHVGPHHKIELAYDALMKWVKEKGFTPTGVAYEFYWNDPTVTPASELKTRISFPLHNS